MLQMQFVPNDDLHFILEDMVDSDNKNNCPLLSMTGRRIYTILSYQLVLLLSNFVFNFVVYSSLFFFCTWIQCITMHMQSHASHAKQR